MLTGSSFEIARPTGVCASSGRTLAAGERYIATLVEGENGLERRDFSLEAWEAGGRPEQPLFGSWRATMPSSDAPRRQLIEDDELLDLFDQLGEAEEDSRLAFRYVLALILMRKKLLVYEGQRREGGAAMLVRPRGVPLPPERGGDGPPLVEVRDPGMDEEKIAEATEQLGMVISGGEE